ncbi:hypothetical protein VPHD51_0014 [Vibrio phage D51]
MNEPYVEVIKDITGSNETSITDLRLAVLEHSGFLAPILCKVTMSSGTLLYPYTTIPDEADTDSVIAGLTLTRNHSSLIRKIVKETVEDAVPEVGISTALRTIMAQQTALKIEKEVVSTIVADANILPVSGAGADWAGIELCIEDMGPLVYNTVGTFTVALSLTDHLALTRDADFDRAMETLKSKFRFVVSPELATGQMIVVHEHGFAGSLSVAAMEEDSSPASDSAELVLPYKTGIGYDLDFIRVVK